MTRAAGHRNRPDTRRNTLWAALTFRSGDYDLALERLRTSMMLNEDRFPELFAVDLALLALSHAALGHDRDGKEALARLEAHLDDHPKARTPRVEAFLAEAREAVRKATTSPAGASGRETAGAATGGG